ncbi:MAG: hypothetical protein NTV22_08495, partial [bacterium]|nr:hypothetical protein [bacterium]
VDLLPTAPPAGGTQRTGTAASLRAFPYVTFMNDINNGGYCRCAFDEVRIADTFNDAMGWAHEPPATPVNLAPANGALNVSITPTLIISNYADVDGDAQVASQWQIARTRDFSTPAWDSGPTASALTTNTVPAGVLASNTLYYWHARVQDSSNDWSAWSSPTFFVTPQDMTITNGITLLVYDTEGATLAMLAAQGYALALWSGGPDPARLLCIGRETLSGGGSLPGSLEQFVSNGGRALLFTQNPDWLRTTLGLRVARHVTRRVFPLDPRHPVVAGLDAEDLRDWRGESTLLPHHDEYSPEAGKVTYGWRWGCNGAVSSAAIEKPHRAGWRPLLECEFDLAYAPLLELDYGNGHVLLGTLDLEDHYARDPAARILLRQLVEYARTNAYVSRTTVVYHGDATGALLVTNTLGVACAIGASTALTPSAGLHIIGAGASISDTDLSTYLTGGGRVVFLPRTATGVQHLGLTLGAQNNYAGSLNPPTNWYEARGLSASDLRFRTSTNVVLVTGGGWEIGADGQLARTNIGAGVAVWCQMDPNRFNHTVTTFFRFTRWRQIRALAQIMANLGAPFADDGAVLRQVSGSYYDPDYRTDFDLGDDPYRYYRW